MVNQRFSGSSGTWSHTNKGEFTEFDRGRSRQIALPSASFPTNNSPGRRPATHFVPLVLHGQETLPTSGWCHGRIRGIPKSPLCFSAKPLAGDYWGTPPLAEEIKELGITNSLKHGRSTCLFLPMMFMGIWFWYIWFHFYLVYMTLGVCPNPVTVGK